MVFYCEQVSGFSSDIASDDEGYFDALVRMFEQALKMVNALSVERRDDLLARLDRVRVISHKIGYGVGDDMDSLMSKFTPKKPVSRFCGDLAARMGFGSARASQRCCHRKAYHTAPSRHRDRSCR